MNPNEVVQNKINELMYNEKNKYEHEYQKKPNINILLESEKLKRKLSLTDILVLDLSPDIAIVSSQYIIINPKTIESFIGPEGLNPKKQATIRKFDVNLTNFISDLLKQSMNESPNNTQNLAKVVSHNELINLIAQKDKKMSQDIQENSLNSNEFTLAQAYFETGNGLEKISNKKFNNCPVYIYKLLKDEINLTTISKDVEVFCTLYEKNKDKEIRSELINGIVAKVVGKVANSRKYIALKAWENIVKVDHLNKEDCPSTIGYAFNRKIELKIEIRKEIVTAVKAIIKNTEEIELLQKGISGYSTTKYMFDVINIAKKVNLNTSISVNKNKF